MEEKKIEFTAEQQAVIDARDSNILVSAAAGSGKTAVLVERIIKMVEAGLDVDHLLVVTFTKAAAGQMKEKITEAIQKKLVKDPENAHLQRQETLIHNAQITTIDSFCQYIIRNNFNTIGLDPSFRVADEGELKIIMEDAMAELMEDEYAAAKEAPESDFVKCVEYFCPGRNDKKIEEYINQLFKNSMSMPWPLDWIRERADDYSVVSENVDEIPFVKSCVSYALDILREVSQTIGSAIKVASEPDGPYMYLDLLEAEKAAVDAALEYDTYDSLSERVCGISFGRLPGKKDDSVNADKKDYVKDLRDEYKTEIKGLREDYFALSSGDMLANMKLCDRAVRELCRLTLEFSERFAEKKKELQVIDFSDMEHFALQILLDHEKNAPTDVALEYREFYKEILIDEYQDSNSVQEMILMAIAGEKAGISERFMVGDVKQSIYKFRLARPELFMEKFRSYSKDEHASDRRIDLHRNFRSRRQVLDLTNYIFEKIMGSDLGGVEYDSDARLIYGASYDKPGMDITPELIMVDGADSLDEPDSRISGLSDREKEALAVAEKIAELRRENLSLKYSDIVILLRSRAGWEDVFKQVLESQGVPVYIESRSGYFEAPEIAVLLQLLSVIDNPRQDIPLLSVMHSRIGGFTDEELALIRIAINECEDSGAGDTFYDGICANLSLGDGLSEKLSSFLEMIDTFRQMTAFTPVHELLLKILDTTGFETTVTAMPGGSQRRANIEMLLGYAQNFEKTSFKGLFHFVRYIEHMRVSQVDYGEAGIIDENADVVRIMSIHKSKGLEFPVVFVSGLFKKFNLMDTKGDIVVDADLGIGVKCVDTVLRVKTETLKRRIIADKMELDCLGEELRVLYVALTRAKEKLIMTAACPDLSKELSKALMKIDLFDPAGGLLPLSLRRKVMSYFDLVLPAVIRHPSMRPLIEKYGLDLEKYSMYEDKSAVADLHITEVGEKDLLDQMLGDSVEALLREEELRRLIEAGYDSDMLERLMKRLSAVYPHENLKGLFTKTTVSELKKAAIEKLQGAKKAEAVGDADVTDENLNEAEKSGISKEVDDTDTTETAWFEEGETFKGTGHLKGAERGTAYHRVMELLDADIYGDENLMRRALDEAGDEKTGPVSKRIYAWIKSIEEKGRISSEAADCIWTPDIVKFLASDIGQRMGSAFRRGQLSREKPFMMGVSAKELDEKFPEDEMVLVQGIIDAFFVEDGKIILLDYKTDRVPDEQTLIDLYKVQLILYKRALESATGMRVKESYLYSFALSRQILLQNNDA